MPRPLNCDVSDEMILNRCCVGSEFRRLLLPLPDRTLDFRHVVLGRDDELWRRYHRPGQNTLPRRPTHAMLTAHHQAQLFHHIDTNLDLYCGPKHNVTADVACVQYRKYLAWEEGLPPVVKDTREEAQPLPHILYLQ